MDLKRSVAVASAAALLFVACGGESEVAEEPTPTPGVVQPGRANWETGYFQAAVYSALLEELGYVVGDPAEHEYPPVEAYRAMAEGAFDFWANGWYSQHLTWHEDELPDGSPIGDHLVILGEQVVAAALEGLVITKSVADDHGIRSLDQINADPELVALFDTDGDGLGEIHGCPESWTCDDIIDELIEFNDWSNLEQVKAEYPGLVRATIERVRAGEPAIQYTWSPSGHLEDLSPGHAVYWLSVGDNSHVLDGTTAGGYDFAAAPPAPFGEQCTGNPCWIGWEVSDIQVTANRAFAEANPMAARLFEVVVLPIEDIVAQNLRYQDGENGEADVRRHAQEWIAANRAVVDAWLTAARTN
ncbi:MAG TPA: glycine betaine/L-proline ABC transporter substrate-binding protein ProX [Acidimicrobiia bacterium]|nr:glycine betaine/L-proline ABC transporter substrate-binding protein ProX [Acidimicrobiia bacterium]